MGRLLPSQGWPSGTPEYLLTGYFGPPLRNTRFPRLTTSATDTARHERLLDVTGGDAAALAEIDTALALIATDDTPDLAGAICLAHHRDYLTTATQESLPILPAVWAILGTTSRAESPRRIDCTYPPPRGIA